MTLVSARGEQEDQRLWAREITKALDALDPMSAAALRLIYHRNTTPADVAAQLGLPYTEVKTLVARGLQRLAGNIGRDLESV